MTIAIVAATLVAAAVVAAAVVAATLVAAAVVAAAVVSTTIVAPTVVSTKIVAPTVIAVVGAPIATVHCGWWGATPRRPRRELSPAAAAMRICLLSHLNALRASSQLFAQASAWVLCATMHGMQVCAMRQMVMQDSLN